MQIKDFLKEALRGYLASEKERGTIFSPEDVESDWFNPIKEELQALFQKSLFNWQIISLEDHYAILQFAGDQGIPETAKIWYDGTLQGHSLPIDGWSNNGVNQGEELFELLGIYFD